MLKNQIFASLEINVLVGRKNNSLPSYQWSLPYFFHLLAQKPNLEKKNSNKFFHNFYLSESSYTCPGLRASGHEDCTKLNGWPPKESCISILVYVSNVHVI